MSGDLAERVREVTGDLMRGLSLELVDAEVSRERGRVFLRLTIDRPGGVTVDDCAKASGLIGQVLERERVLDGPYTLEVMSPGLDRPLREPDEFVENVGRRVQVKMQQSFEGQRIYSGILRSADAGAFTIDVGEELMEFGYEGVRWARLDPELPW